MKMDKFSRIALHEVTHYNSVGPATSLSQQIKDWTNEDNESAYDLPRVHNLVDSKQDNNPIVTRLMPIAMLGYRWTLELAASAHQIRVAITGRRFSLGTYCRMST